MDCNRQLQTRLSHEKRAARILDAQLLLVVLVVALASFKHLREILLMAANFYPHKNRPMSITKTLNLMKVKVDKGEGSIF